MQNKKSYGWLSFWKKGNGTVDFTNSFLIQQFQVETIWFDLNLLFFKSLRISLFHLINSKFGMAITGNDED